VQDHVGIVFGNALETRKKTRTRTRTRTITRTKKKERKGQVEMVSRSASKIENEKPDWETYWDSS